MVSRAAQGFGGAAGTTPDPARSRPFTIVKSRERLSLAGELSMKHARAIHRELVRCTKSVHGKKLEIDLGGVSFVDGGIMALLLKLRTDLGARGTEASITSTDARVTELLRLYGGEASSTSRTRPERQNAVSHVGAVMQAAGAAAAGAVSFFGELTAAIGGVLRHPATGNWRAVLPLAERAGADGVPIVLLLNCLVGFVMGFQSANQLELYGANIFVADIVGISVVRELAPLMTAIIVSGRSGAAFAAELGTMRVSEEIDALRTMGFVPIRYLVLPRVVALALVTPVLTLLGDVVGVAGGAVVGVIGLDVGFRAYLAELRTAVFAWDIGTGLIKSVAYGVAIALIGCRQGFATRGGAAGVGRRTTATVVLCLFTIVVIDTIFTVFFRMVRV